MPSDSLSIGTDGPIAIVTLNRPQVRNALDAATLAALEEVLLRLKQDEGARSVIVTGAGDRAFVAGADIGELSRLSGTEARAYALAGQRVFDLIEHLGKPVIAAVNGRALGGGCELALACHLRVASDTAAFGQPEVKLGLIPGFGGTQRLPRLIGKSRALELLLTGREVGADEALRVGLVHRVVPAAELMPACRAWALELSALPPLALANVLDAVARGMEMSFPEAAFLEAALFGAVAGSEDAREGTRAFLEKRRPAFKGR
ncbi:MAG TPA: enoyl-CoA hydratase-related protein [Vicinamibacterales bacterium]|nr:enoyl-CoA hydratase-related protein [Vicinamibacterales bacterium]